MATFFKPEVAGWDVDSVCGWLDLIGLKDCIDTFRESDVNGVTLLDMLEDEDIIGDLGLSFSAGKTLLAALAEIKDPDPAQDDMEWPPSDDSDLDVDDSSSSTASSTAAPASTASGATGEVMSPTGAKKKTKKTKDPLRIAAKSRSVATLEPSTVTSGYLYKVGGSGLKMKHWNKRFFVLTDDNCIYYFKSPKDMSALGLIMLPSYTITTADKSENPGGRPFAWKAVNRINESERKYVFAAETEAEMRAWMNFMSLASIAFGSGKASASKPGASARLADDTELSAMAERAAARAGGVEGADAPIAAVQTAPHGPAVPAHLAKTSKEAKKAGRTLALIQLLDGAQLQLYAEPGTTGQNFLDQVCTLLGAHEKYYFGLSYMDKKGDQQWIEMEQKVMKHDFPKGEHIELEFMIRFHPIDVTQVMQYVTLYQAFLAARRDVVKENIATTGKDSMLLAALSLQAIRGDYDPAIHSKASISPADLIPAKTMREARIPQGIHPSRLEDFWRDELIRCWLKTTGILKHLAVLKYMQIIQKHRLYGMTFVDVKNKKGTPLVLGISPRGLFVYRVGKTDFPIVKFTWGECSELAFAEKRFTISTPDKNTKPFSVYCPRTKIALRVLKQCVGLHKLYIQTVQQWASPPPDLARMRKEAIKAALDERAKLQEESTAARERAEQRRVENGGATPVSPTSPPESPTKSESGRGKAVELIDMMMQDSEFMEMQAELMRMEADLGEGYDDVGGDEGGEDPEDAAPGRERCVSASVSDRAQYLESLGQPGHS